MHPSASIDDFLNAPLGRYYAGRTHVLWVRSHTLAGAIYFDRPGARDAADLFRLAPLTFDPGLSDPYDALVDASLLRELEEGAFSTLVEHLAGARSFSARIRRVALVRPQGVTGAAIAGLFFEAVREHFEAALFAHRSEAMAWFGRADAGAANADLDALASAVCGPHPLVRQLRDYLATALDDASLDTAARALGVSSRSLQRKLSEASTTFSGELEGARVREAERLLLHTDDKIEAIARATGCVSTSHFGKMFRAATGESAADFRARRRR
ncbi:MAG: helix-turn-helix transcriptional regulator [Polyangiaceae bacterium]|nr:helix-turn-helix transcriptional regulator [Polyangiaceae bacterium]